MEIGDIPVSLEINASRERVQITGTSHWYISLAHLTGTSTLPSLFGGIIGKTNLAVSDIAAAKLTVADVVCVGT